jgi:hypothetical protein
MYTINNENIIWWDGKSTYLLLTSLKQLTMMKLTTAPQLVSKHKVTRRKRGFLVRVGAMSEDGKFRVEKFNGQNYQLWKMHMEDYYLGCGA